MGWMFDDHYTSERERGRMTAWGKVGLVHSGALKGKTLPIIEMYFVLRCSSFVTLLNPPTIDFFVRHLN